MSKEPHASSSDSHRSYHADNQNSDEIGPKLLPAKRPQSEHEEAQIGPRMPPPANEPPRTKRRVMGPQLDDIVKESSKKEDTELVGPAIPSVDAAIGPQQPQPKPLAPVDSRPAPRRRVMGPAMEDLVSGPPADDGPMIGPRLPGTGPVEESEESIKAEHEQWQKLREQSEGLQTETKLQRPEWMLQVPKDRTQLSARLSFAPTHA